MRAKAAAKAVAKPTADGIQAPEPFGLVADDRFWCIFIVSSCLSKPKSFIFEWIKSSSSLFRESDVQVDMGEQFEECLELKWTG